MTECILVLSCQNKMEFHNFFFIKIVKIFLKRKELCMLNAFICTICVCHSHQKHTVVAAYLSFIDTCPAVSGKKESLNSNDLMVCGVKWLEQLI